MKKMYKKPQTEKVPLVPNHDMLQFVGGGSTPVEKPSEPGTAAPQRRQV